MAASKTYAVRTGDDEIWRAYRQTKEKIGIVHTDAPTEMELCKVRACIDSEGMISLNWLRNKIVALRKHKKRRAMLAK